MINSSIIKFIYIKEYMPREINLLNISQYLKILISNSELENISNVPQCPKNYFRI